MKIETYEQGTGKIIEIKELDYSNGTWTTYDGKGNLVKKESMTKEQIEQFNQEQKRNRESEFKSEADPLFLKYQAGEIEKEEWKTKRKEIRERNPYIGDQN